MRRVIYSMGMSVDGFVAGPNGELDWVTPDAEVHRFWNDQARETGTSLYGRRMYELMTEFWPTADQDPSAPPEVVEFARIWRDIPRVVFSTTLERVDEGSTLVRGDVVDEVKRLKAQPGGDMDVGGPTLASTLIRNGLVDEYRPVVHPVVLGEGIPFLPPMDRPIELQLVETRRFESGVVYLRYEAAGSDA
jgi:dihydrofolate reductase